MKRKAIAALFAWGILTGTAGAVGNTVDVTVHDRAENRVLPVYQHQGRYYLVGRPGNESPDPRAQSQRRGRAGRGLGGRRQRRERGDCKLGPDRLRARAAPGVRYQGLEKEPRARGGFLLHGTSELLCRANRPPGQRRRDRRGGVSQESSSPKRAFRARSSRWSGATLLPSRGAGRTHPRRTHRRAESDTARQAPSRRRNPRRSVPGTGGANPRASPTRSSSAPPRTPRKSSRSTTTRIRIWSRWA